MSHDQIKSKDVVLEQLVDALESHPEGPVILETVLQKPAVQKALETAKKPLSVDDVDDFDDFNDIDDVDNVEDMMTNDDTASDFESSSSQGDIISDDFPEEQDDSIYAAFDQDHTGYSSDSGFTTDSDASSIDAYAF